MTRTEKIVKRQLETEGWMVLHSGWPDFLAFKETSVGRYDCRAVEVKSRNGELSKSQILMEEILGDGRIPIGTAYEREDGSMWFSSYWRPTFRWGLYNQDGDFEGLGVS